jgi:anti-anti-sigma factor
MVWKVEEIDEEGQKAVIELEGVVDSTNVDQFFGFINSVFKKGIKRMVLDLEYTSYLSSGGLSVIIDAFKKAQSEGGKMVIARPSDMIKELFEVVQFERIIEFYDSLDEALGAI